MPRAGNWSWLTARPAAPLVVQNLLSFARPPQPHKVCVHLSDLIQRSLQLHEHSLRTNGIALDFVPKPDLPLVMGDASQLTQVFLNLITNAEQAIREVHTHGTIRIRLGALGDRVMATIQDDGGDIDPANGRENLRSILHHEAPRPRDRSRLEHLPGYPPRAQREH